VLNISFDVIYKLKMGLKVVQKHSSGMSKWRISNGRLESCFIDNDEDYHDWVIAPVLVLDPDAVYSFEPEKVNKNEWY
jgi:hypothetical protein